MTDNNSIEIQLAKITETLDAFRRETSVAFNQINDRFDVIDNRFEHEGNAELLAEICQLREDLKGEAEFRQHLVHSIN